MTAYDPNNVFARILRGELPCRTLYENEHALAFPDLHPQAPVHVLIIPKGAYVSFEDFAARARPEEVLSLTQAITAVAKQTGVAATGYRIISNHGADSGQEVPHFHVHLMGGRKLIASPLA